MNHISKAIGLMLLMLLLASLAKAEQVHQVARSVAEHIAGFIKVDEPILMDIRCGEWTPALTQSLTELLLNSGADIRESTNHVFSEDETAASDTISLQTYSLKSANLVRISLSMKWQVIEKKSFFSYQSERKPIYSFEVKQIRLPNQQLKYVNTYDYMPKDSKDSTLSSARLRWFEPLVATTALGTLIFLLWTIE